MVIYGVAILALCTVVGAVLGDLLGLAIGVKANVGGVGIAMLLLVAIRWWMVKAGGLAPPAESAFFSWYPATVPAARAGGC